MKTRKMMAAAGVMMAVVLAGYGVTGMASTEETRGVIGYLGDETDEKFAEGIREEASEQGYKVVTAKGDSNLITDCIDVLEQGADVIVVPLAGEEETQRVIEAAHDNDVDVVLKTIKGSEADYDKLVVQEGSVGGNAAAVCAVELLEGK